MTSKPVVLIIENSVALTGALKSIARTSYDLKEFFHFHFVIPKGSKGRLWIEGNGFQSIWELPMKEISRRLFGGLIYLPYLFVNAIRLNALIKSNKVALVHVNDLYNLLPVVVRLFGSRTPYVCHIRFLPDRFPPWLFNFWLKLHLRYASRIVAVSQTVLDQLNSHPKLILIHGELPSEERYPELVISESLNASFTFLYLSNFMQGKGQDYALEAFARVCQKLPNWKLRFIGGDMGMGKNQDYRETLKERAKALGVFDRTEWKEFTGEVEGEYKQADIVLNFSESESFSMTCVEALYFGRPLIATDCGGPSEIIDHLETGVLVPNRGLNEMADAMLNLATHSSLRNKMAINGRMAVRERFSIERTSYRLRAVYNNAIHDTI